MTWLRISESLGSRFLPRFPKLGLLGELGLLEDPVRDDLKRLVVHLLPVVEAAAHACPRAAR